MITTTIQQIDMSDFFIQKFCDFNKSCSVIIEDDERVCYAYLMQNEDIIGDVWLYNISSTPISTNWNDSTEMPFLNPQDFIQENLQPIDNENEVDLKWKGAENKVSELYVEIWIRGRLVAKMKPGSLPGWSTLVIKDGPLAKVL